MEEDLKSIILSRYKSVNDFANAIGVPQSTIASIFKRGIDKAGVQTILKIFNALDLDVESISTGKLKKSDVLTDSELTKKYRALDEHGREIVDAVLDIEYKRVQSRTILVAARGGGVQHIYDENADTLEHDISQIPQTDEDF